MLFVSDSQDSDKSKSKARLTNSPEVLDQLFAVAHAGDDEFSATERAIRRTVLDARALRGLRLAAMERLFAEGLTTTEVKLAFLTNEKLIPLMSHWEEDSESGFNKFKDDMRIASKKVKGDSGGTALSNYKRILRQVLTQATRSMASAGGSQVRPLLELASSTARTIAVMEGAIFQQAGQMPEPSKGGRKITQYAPSMPDGDVVEEEGVELDEFEVSMEGMMDNFEPEEDDYEDTTETSKRDKSDDRSRTY